MRNKLFIATFIITFVLLFTSCSIGGTLKLKGKEYTLTKNDKKNQIKTYTSEDNKILTIDRNNNAYILNYHGDEYTVTGSKDDIKVVYPNGETGWMRYSGNSACGGGSMSFKSNYFDIDDLRDLVFIKGKMSFNGEQLFFSIVLGIACLISVMYPEKSWYLSRGWKYRNAEPSDTYLELTKVGGVIGCIVSVIGIITSFSFS